MTKKSSLPVADTLAGYHWLAFVLLMLKDLFDKSA
jgi:hypothetical protein